MRSVIFAFDRFLRRRLGIFEFSSDPGCLLRLRLRPAGRPVELPGGRIAQGTPVLELHMWNEHAPPLPESGPDLAWAVRSQRMLMASFRSLAEHLRSDPRLAGIQALTGVTVLALAAGGADGVSLFRRMGFTVLPYHGPLGRFGEFWENLYTWGIMGAFNAPSLSRRRLLWLRRSEIWMTTDAFLARYGGGAAPRHGA